MIVLIDNYDSFTFNLFHYLGGLGADVVVHRNDKISTADVIAAAPEAIVLSPGPCTPNEAGICLDLIAKASSTIPILGVCLGHQAIGQAFGGKVVRAPVPVHGKLSTIKHRGEGVFRGINGPFQATRYHSLVVERATMPAELGVTAETDDGLVMGAAHTSLPVHGVQFHPESIASEHGHLILKNFLDIAAAWNAATGRSSRKPQPSPRSALRAQRLTVTDDFKALIAKAATGASLTREEAARGFDRMMSGEATPSQMGGLLMALRVRGETVDEITGAVVAMRDKMLRVERAARRHRHRRHRRRRVRLLQHLDLRGLHRGRRRRAGRQARQPRALLALRRRRRARRARRQDRADAGRGRPLHPARPASASCSRPRIIRR